MSPLLGSVCRCDAEDVPSSIIAVEVEGLWAGRGTSSSGFSTFVPIPNRTNVRRPWYLVHAHLVTVTNA